MSKYGVNSGPHFSVFGLNTVINLRIQSEYRKIRNRNNSVFEHFSLEIIVMHTIIVFQMNNSTCLLMFYTDPPNT